jgi:hypothetical protein
VTFDTGTIHGGALYVDDVIVAINAFREPETEPECYEGAAANEGCPLSCAAKAGVLSEVRGVVRATARI